MDSLAVLQHTLDGLPYGVTVWRAESQSPDDLRLVYANARASKEAGVDLQGFVGGLARGFLDRPTAPADPVPNAGAGQIIPRYVYTDASGHTREFRIHMVPVWDRTVALTYEALGPAPPQEGPVYQFRDYFEDIVRTLREPLVVLDSSLRIAWANAVFLGLFGLSAAHVEGRSFIECAVPVDKDRELERRLGEVLPCERPIEGAEFSLVAFDGTTRICILNARRLNSHDSREELMLVALEEVTERRRREALQMSFVESLVRARDEERRAIARDLHDRVGQALTSHTVLLQQIEHAGDLTAAREQARKLHDLVEGLLEEVGGLVSQLHPYRLEQLGLVAALRQYLQEFAELHALHVDFEATGWRGDDEKLESELEIGLYRIVQEALTNVARHANASSVSVTLHRDADRVRAVVEDDGCGFEPNRAPGAEGGLGLVALHERARLMQGSLSIESSKQGGTTLAVSIPLNPCEATV